jgi:hypothetical protein
MNNSKITAHLKSDKHTIYETTCYTKRQAQQHLPAALSNKNSIPSNWRASDAIVETCAFRRHFVKTLLTSAPPLYRADGTLRSFIESVPNDALDHSSNLKRDYVPRLLELERKDLEREVH